MKESISTSRTITNTLHYVFCIGLSIIVLFPIYMGVMAGFKTNGQLFTDPVGLPIHL